ncbi:MAG: serine/threonine-protein kinase, partial [Candidatus Obscuribacterales bacterium]|nr:serine/threonine-protein kinase [Candidatus Obscuribacterales bacterium]
MSQEKQKSKKLELVCADCGRPRKSASVTGWIFGGSINTCNCVSMARGRLDTSIAVAATSLEDELEKRSRTRRRKEPDLFLASRYKIGELVGVGGMGAVYKAHYTQLAKTFAIKILQQELAADPTALRRFEREAGAVGQLSHPNIVAVYEFGMTQDASPYLVMDYLDGEGLDARLRSEVYLSGETVADLFIQVADALAHAHNKSIVHRDIKPSNMILLKDENDNDLVKLVDFGIAKIMPEGDKTTLGTTQTGELIGSPWYMSPEQCAGKTIDGRSDIYSAGCVMYEAITGKPPFCGDNLVQIILHHVNEPSPRPRDKHPSLEIHEDLEYIVLRCLEKNPEDRYQNADSLKQDLELFRAGVPIKKIVSKNRDFSSTQKLSRLGLKANLLLGLSTVLLLSGIVISTLFITDGFGLIGLSGGANGDSVSRWTELVKIGQESFDQGEYKSASHSLKEALSLAEKMQTKPEYLRTSLNHMRDLSVVEKNTSETNFIDARIAGLNSADDEQLKSIERQLDEAINDDTKDRDYYNDLANSANDSLASLIEAGRYEPADRLLTKAFELTEKKVGARSQVMTRCLHNRAYLDHDLGDYKKALAGYEKALALERDVFGKQHVIIASTQLRLARLRLQLGIADQQTKDYLNDALSIYRNLQGPYSDNVGLS